MSFELNKVLQRIAAINWSWFLSDANLYKIFRHVLDHSSAKFLEPCRANGSRLKLTDVFYQLHDIRRRLNPLGSIRVNILRPEHSGTVTEVVFERRDPKLIVPHHNT